ncbi:MAG: hypothetical protein RLY65_477 [Pseudomonadota bacterium]
MAGTTKPSVRTGACRSTIISRYPRFSALRSEILFSAVLNDVPFSAALSDVRFPAAPSEKPF